MRKQQSILLGATQMITIKIVAFSFIQQKLLLNFSQGHFMTLHFAVTLKLKTVIKKSDRQPRRSVAGSYAPRVVNGPTSLGPNPKT